MKIKINGIKKELFIRTRNIYPLQHQPHPNQQHFWINSQSESTSQSRLTLVGTQLGSRGDTHVPSQHVSRYEHSEGSLHLLFSKSASLYINKVSKLNYIILRLIAHEIYDLDNNLLTLRSKVLVDIFINVNQKVSSIQHPANQRQYY